MQLKKTYWLQLAAVMMLMMQAAGLHAHISIDANDTSIQSHLQAAESHGVPALVFTSLSQDRLQVDWYRRGGVVVDLGEIER